ncbi:TolC family protein [Luteimonas aquatica]|uniref:TolC family protein n=1 Tax=Luteimonas aquatica TaxID=450364 RepID=UPI001F58B463|nr:TolC family protein [Luteimonas aquatica]
MFVRFAAAAASIAVACMLAMPARAADPPVSPSDAIAQARAPDAVREAVRDAWLRYPGQQAAQAQLAATQARRDAAAQPLYNPELSFNRDDEGTDVTTTAGASLTLDLSGKRRVRRDAAEARVDQSAATAKLLRRDFARRWFADWSALQSAQRRVAVGERRLSLTRRFAEIAGRQFAAGDISGAERDLAQLAHDEAQAQQATLVAERAQAEAGFAALGGDAQALQAQALPSDSLPPPVAADEAVEGLPEWQVADAAARVAEREIAVARRNRVPDPTVGFNAGRIRMGGASDNVFGVSLSIPLFVRNSYRAEVVAANADADAANAERRRVALELGAERRRATDSYASALSAWKQWRGSRATDVERRADLLERTWREGEISTSDYLLQLKQSLDTALAGAELEARLWQTYTDYLAAVGRIERWAGLEATP